MDKSIVKSFLGKNGQEIYITSEDGKAVSYTGNSNFKVRTELGLKYEGGFTLAVVNPKDFRSKKVALELLDADELAYAGGKVFIGKKDKSISAEAAAYDQMPDFALFDGADCGTFKFQSDEIKRLMHLADCASTDKTHPFMCGVFFNVNGEIAATDSRQLCVWKTENKYPKVIVHREAFQPFAKSKELQMTVKGSGLRYIELTDGKTTVRTTEIDGTFPNYPKVIPDKKGYADAEGFSIDFKKYGGYIKSTGNKYREPVLQLFNDAVYCGDMQIGFLNFNIDPLVINAKYLQDALENVGGKVSWRRVQRDRIGEKIGYFEETPYVTRALIFGDLDSYFDVVMPSVPDDDNTDEIFRKMVEKISHKIA